jgi:hypothetical protein
MNVLLWLVIQHDEPSDGMYWLAHQSVRIDEAYDLFFWASKPEMDEAEY